MAIKAGASAISSVHYLACSRCALREWCLSRALDGADLAQLERLLERPRPLPAGRSLYRSGAPLTALYVVLSGALKTSTLTADGGLQVIDFHLPGELLGLDGLASGRHSCEAETLQRSHVCALPFAQLQSLSAEVPSLQRELLRHAGRKAVHDQEHLGILGHRDALRRLAFFLLNFSERRGLAHLENEQFQLPMSRLDLANYLGLAKETISRGFTHLDNEGVLGVKRKSVHIRNRSALMRLCADGEYGLERAAG